MVATVGPTASSLGPNRHGRMSVLRAASRSAAQRLDVERSRPLDLRTRHRFEEPIAERQADPDRPAQRRAWFTVPVRGRQRCIDLDRHAVPVAAIHDESRRGLERGDRRRRTSRPGRRRAARPSVSRRATIGPLVSAFDGQDAARDEPRRPGRESASLAKTASGDRAIVESMVTSIAISPAPRHAVAAGTRARGRAARRACRSAGSARGRRAHDRRPRGVRRSRVNRRSPTSTSTCGSANRLSAHCARSPAATTIDPSGSST